jgi:serine/threonine-protein kinase
MTADTSELANIARPGDVLLGKYRIERVLGVGGMGAVVEARHLQLDDRVAIKFLLASMVMSSEVVTRFLREGRAAAKIRNEHVVRVFDVGMLETGAPYMVMEFLEGQDLSQLVEKHGGMPPAQAVDWVLEACEAIAEAHAAGVVHRDLKPANLFLHEKSDGSHTIKVLDFGISKLSEAADAGNFGMTKTQAVMGSPRYMSPEQMRSSRSVDARSDVWALGTVLHELLAGAPPFDAETMPELCARILADPPRPLHQFRQDLPPGIEEAILGALQKDPATRYQNVAHFAAALAPFGTAAAAASAARAARLLKLAPGQLSQSNPSGRVSNVGSMPPAATQTATGSAWTGSRSAPGTTTATKSGSLGLIVGGAIGALLLVAAVGVGGVLFAKRGSPPAASAAATTATPTAASVTPPSSPATTTASAPSASPAPDTTASAAPAVASATSPPQTGRPNSPPPPPVAVTGAAPARPTPVPKPKPPSNPFDDR